MSSMEGGSTKMEDSPPSEASLKDSLKKRPRSDVDGGGNGGGDRRNPESKVTTTTTRNTLSNIRRLRLEAIFYPKFDNEKQDHSNNNTNNKNDDDNNKNQQKLIRQQMIQRVADRKGYLEVTLKHSGSLVLWSGGTQRFYSKNSTSNQFTLVAEILLRQHMERAWRTTTTLVQEEGDGGNNVGLVKYQELCDYLQEHRYTIAFEVVAAVLGDHGDIPHKDFLIATAVADRPNERFLSTVEVITFCQNFHLPHNDTWAFTTRDGTEHLFQLYDTCRETGLATDTICALSESAQAHVASMYPHSIFQGEILEGFVIRYIEYPKVHDQEQQHEHDNEREEEKIEPLQRQIQGLAVTAQQILQEVPPSLPPSFEVEDDTESILFKTDIRKLFQEMDGPRLGLNAGEAFSQVLEKVLSTEDGGTQMRRTTERIPSKDFDLPSITASLRSSKDVETRRIAEMLHTVGSLSKLVSYKLLEEQSPSMMTSSSSSSSSTTATTTRTLCIIHVLHDQTFFKYHRVKNDDTMDLFRGFCVELGTEEEDLDASTVPDNSDVVAMDCDGDGGSGTKEEKPSSLMLKMKLLPYMIRTFICRNRLNVIEQDGPAAFVTQARKQFRMWSISEQATLKHMPFLEQWANYAKSQMSGVTTTATTEQGLPPLSSFSYLKHLEYFQTQFEQEIRLGTFKEAFQGFACIVALKEETAKIAACAVADRLNDDAVAEVLSLKDAMNGCRMRGVICYGVLDDYSLKIRNFLGDVQRYSTIALLGCSEEEIEQQLSEPTKVKKKWKALSQRWSQELAQSHLSFPMSVMSGDTSSSLEYLDTAVAAITQAATCAPWNEESWDARPGVVVFFPGIPGSGKSSLVGSKQKELNEFLASNNGSEMRRNVDVLVGDELGKSFWTTVKTIRSKNAPSAVTVLDKNTPPSSWRIVGDVCSSTNAFPLAVFPDSSSLKTTRICGMKSPGGSFRPEKSHFYPFSLEYLAICVARVLQRPPSTHIGQLDSGSKIAAMIVVMFYTFYRYSSAEDLRDDIDRTLKGAGALDSLEPIQVPFVSETTTTGEFPVEILQTLEEALQLLMGYDHAKFSGKKEQEPLILAMEAKLRQSIANVQDELFAKGALLETSQTAFMNQLQERIQSLSVEKEVEDSMECDETVPTTNNDDTPNKIRLVAIDVPKSSVHGLLKHEAETNSTICDFLDSISKGSHVESWKTDHFPGYQFVEKTHVTMMYWTETSQATMRELFGPHCGAAVDLYATGILWDDQVAALEVNVSPMTRNGKDLPKSQNPFVHITVWVAPTAEAWMSNRLLNRIDQGLAQRVEFRKALPLEGIVSFWNL